MFKKYDEIVKEIKKKKKNFWKNIIGIVIGLLLTGLGISMPRIFTSILPEILNIPETALIAILTTIFGGLTSIYNIVSSIISKVKIKKLNGELDDEILDIKYQISELARQYNIEKEKLINHQNTKNKTKTIKNTVNLSDEYIQNEEKEYVKVKTR